MSICDTASPPSRYSVPAFANVPPMATSHPAVSISAPAAIVRSATATSAPSVAGSKKAPPTSAITTSSVALGTYPSSQFPATDHAVLTAPVHVSVFAANVQLVFPPRSLLRDAVIPFAAAVLSRTST